MTLRLSVSILNIVFKEGELQKDGVVAKFATTAADEKTYQVEYYNLDVIIGVGYRVKSRQGVRFRIWATQRLKDYLVEGYAINEKRLAQKEMQVQHLKTGINAPQITQISTESSSANASPSTKRVQSTAPALVKAENALSTSVPALGVYSAPY